MISCFECSSIEDYKINEIVKKTLFAGNKFMPEMHLKQPRFTFSACGHLLKVQKELKNWKKEQKNRRYKAYLQKWIRKSLLSA